MARGYFVTGIGTGVGKTVVAAALAHHFHADYWKPIQCGDLDNTDSMKVQAFGIDAKRIHPERYRLQAPMSPHAAAELEGINMELQDFVLPRTRRPLIVEGAGGLMVPINSSTLTSALIKKLKLPVVLVVRHYLGSINHTLLTCHALQKLRLPIAGMVYSGTTHIPSERVIAENTRIPVLGRVAELKPGAQPHFRPTIIV